MENSTVPFHGTAEEMATAATSPSPINADDPTGSFQVILRVF
jgi:hypothetical protein